MQRIQLQNFERGVSKDCVCCISQYWSSLLLGDLKVHYKLTAFPIDFDGGKSHGRKITKSEKSATNFERSANPVPKSKDV